MRNHKRLVIIVTLLILFFPFTVKVFAMGEADLKFQRITVEDGLSQASVNKVFQDSKGYMWFGTFDGLNRYNGKDIRIYKNIIGESNSLVFNSIADIIEDDEGNIWVATSEGLNKIENVTENIIRIKNDKTSEEGISDCNVWDLLIDSKGTMWVGTEYGLNKYDKEKKTFKKYFKENNNNSLVDNYVKVMCEDDYGHIWIGTENGLSILDVETGKFENIRELDNKPLKPINLEKDNLGNIWINTKELGVIKTHFKDGHFESLEKLKFNNEIENNIQSILFDHYGNLWLGSARGAAKYDPISKKINIYKNKASDQTSLVNDSVISLYEDKAGLIWFGTYNGISILNPDQKFNHYKKDFTNEENSLSDNMISGIYEDDDNILWIGTNSKGLNALNRENGKIKKYMHDANDKESISDDKIWTIKGANDGGIWIATASGVNKLDKSRKKIEKFEFHNNSSKYSKDVRTLYEDKDGVLWIGTRGGLQSYNTKSKEFKVYNKEFEEKNIIDKYINSICEDTEDPNILWIGTGIKSGLIKFHKTKGVIKSYINDPEDYNSLSCNSVKNIAIDHKGDLWIATKSGLNYFDTHEEKFITFDEKDGLVNNFIYGILLDDKGNPWVSTNGGLSKLDLEDVNYDMDKALFLNFTISDGLQSNEFNGQSFYKSKNGEMFFGGINGITAFFPDKINETTYEASIVIDGIKVHDKKLDVKNNNIILNYNENSIAFEFFLPDYRNAKKISYEYKLEGVDDEWVFAKDRNYANYTLLKPGKYLFRVRARNGNGELCKETTMNITIKKAPWRTPIAYFIFFLIALGLVLFIWNYVKILEKLVKQRTAQLNKKLKENSKLYDKLIEQEKIKNNYFVNLSHELRTPLNIILSTIQLLASLNKTDKIDKQVMNKYLPIVKKNSNNLLNVINDLIDTSKIESGNYNIKIKSVDIVFLVEEVALSMKEYIEGLGIDIIIDPDMEEKIIECDSTEIERCVINLLSNSAKYTPKGGCIWVYIKENIKDFIEIIVKDNGIGIAKEDQEIIFDRFSQVKDCVSNGKQSSSGIGLTLVKNLITLHKGTISVHSELGKGSEFIIKLPVKQS